MNAECPRCGQMVAALFVDEVAATDPNSTKCPVTCISCFLRDLELVNLGPSGQAALPLHDDKRPL